MRLLLGEKEEVINNNPEIERKERRRGKEKVGERKPKRDIVGR